MRDSAFGHRNRALPVPGARRALGEWLAERGAEARAGEALFTARGGRRMSLRAAEDVLSQVGRAAGVPLSSRALRNTRAGQMARSGLAPTAVAGFLGHARPETLRPFAVPEAGAAGR